MDKTQIEAIKAMASEVCKREACELYDVEFVGRGRGRILRVFIDLPGTQGVSIDQCANVSRGLSLLLDVDDVVPDGAYELEVSSPGLERPLREVWHFKSALGESVKVRTREGINWPTGQQPANPKTKKLKVLNGVLKAVEERGIALEYKDALWMIPFDIIHRAHVVYRFNEFNNKKRG